MSVPKYIRRDHNDHPLKELAERLGWWLHKLDQPSDYLGLFRGHWFPIEIKNPELEGHANEFTQQQKIFHREAHLRGAQILIWRAAEDVYRDSGARRSA